MKKKMPKVRCAVALQMLLTRKGGAMRDRKKHANKMACRGKVESE
jgi:hypothetical protein